MASSRQNPAAPLRSVPERRSPDRPKSGDASLCPLCRIGRLTFSERWQPPISSTRTTAAWICDSCPHAEPVRASLHASASVVVLLVEPHEGTRNMYAEILRSSGFTVISTKDGVSAALEARAHVPSIAVTDLHLAGDVSAADLCRYFGTLAVPVIVTTGIGAGREHDEIEEAGCAVLRMKPYAHYQLVTEIRRILAIPRELSEQADS